MSRFHTPNGENFSRRSFHLIIVDIFPHRIINLTSTQPIRKKEYTRERTNVFVQKKNKITLSIRLSSVSVGVVVAVSE
jgi:hypothetical protein